MSEPSDSATEENRPGPAGPTAPMPVEIDVAPRDPETIALEILLEARLRLSTGPSPCAADSERLLARTAWLVFERNSWSRERADSIRSALERLLPAR